ncbi:MAG: hypothetical protein AAGG09_07990 [Pseudomonadota bacterium]
MTASRVLGPTTARNWGWSALLATLALSSGLAAADAVLRAGVGGPAMWGAGVLALCMAVAAGWVWRQPAFERTALHLTAQGVAVEGRTRRVVLAWAEIAAVTHRPSSMGPAHMTLERAAPMAGAAAGADTPTPTANAATAEDSAAGDVPGVMFPVRATGASAEEVVAFLARGAAEAGYSLVEPHRGDVRALHRFPGPRRWVMTRRAPAAEESQSKSQG